MSPATRAAIADACGHFGKAATVLGTKGQHLDPVLYEALHSIMKGLLALTQAAMNQGEHNARDALQELLTPEHNVRDAGPTPLRGRTTRRDEL